MGQVIKALDAAHGPAIRPIPLDLQDRGAGTEQLDERAVQLAEAERRIGELNDQLADIRRQNKELVTLAEDRFRDGEKQGYEAGLSAAASQEADRLSAISAAGQRALEDFRAELAHLERLAPVLAVRSLEKILGKPDDLASLLKLTVKEQIKQIDTDAVLWVEVADTDFADRAALDRLHSDIGAPQLKFRTAHDLQVGGCRIRMRLGQLDVSLPRQWAALRQALLAAADAPVEP